MLQNFNPKVQITILSRFEGEYFSTDPKDIPAIAKETDAIIYKVNRIGELEHLRNALIIKLVLKKQGNQRTSNKQIQN